MEKERQERGDRPMQGEHVHSTPQETSKQEWYDPHELRTLLSWSAPGRPFQKKSKEYFMNILVIMLLVEIILFLFSQYVMMVLVLALVFLSYALNTVPPHNFHYRLTTEGIMVEDHFFIWQELYDFYFKKQSGEEVMVIRTKVLFPGELYITLGEMHKDHIIQILLPYLPYREYVRPSFMEKSGEWLERNFPLEKRPSAHK